MPRPPLTERQRADAEARRRSAILGAMAGCVAEHGYAATTIAQVASGARVSKSAVYAHFADKEELFLELYTAATERLLTIIREADDAAREAQLPWRERIRATAAAYLSAMSAGGDLARALLVEVPAVSPRARAVRRDAINRYVEELTRISEALADEHPELAVPRRSLIVAGVGGANELLLEALESDEPLDSGRIATLETDLASFLLSPFPRD